MRRRFVQSVVTALLALTLTAVGGVRPAQAFNPTDITKYLNLVTQAYSLVKNIFGGGSSDAAIKDAVRQIVAEIQSSKTEILTHVDALASAEARACARHHVIEFADIDVFTPDTLQQWAQDATGCVTLIDSLLGVVTDKAQLDELGLALNVAGPIALAARARAGFSTAGLVTTLETGNTTVTTALFPTCRARYIEGMFEWWNCVAYNGDSARSDDYNGRLIAANQATANTSRAVALTALPLLAG